MRKYVCYYRVSTREQGRSGLGLEAQKSTASQWVSGRGGEIIAEHVEVESGKRKRKRRPILDQAIAEAQSTGATLLVAKVDRLSRDVEFLFNLRNSKIDFCACDLPDFSTLSLGIFATIAQHEREIISRRTRDALAARRARGLSLGKPENWREEVRLAGLAARQEIARSNVNNRRAIAVARLMARDGLTLQRIADYLNENGYQTSSGKQFFPMSVSRLLKREEMSQ